MKHNLLDNAKRDLIIELSKVGKKEKRNYLVAIADAMDVSSRNFTSVNVFKLEELAKTNKDKVFVIPGNVLAFGTLKTKVKVYAYKYSKQAEEKISDAKGEAKSLYDLIKDKVPGKDIILVK